MSALKQFLQQLHTCTTGKNEIAKLTDLAAKCQPISGVVSAIQLQFHTYEDSEVAQRMGLFYLLDSIAKLLPHTAFIEQIQTSLPELVRDYLPDQAPQWVTKGTNLIQSWSSMNVFDAGTVTRCRQEWQRKTGCMPGRAQPPPPPPPGLLQPSPPPPHAFADRTPLLSPPPPPPHPHSTRSPSSVTSNSAQHIAQQQHQQAQAAQPVNPLLPTRHQPILHPVSAHPLPPRSHNAAVPISDNPPGSQRGGKHNKRHHILHTDVGRPHTEPILHQHYATSTPEPSLSSSGTTHSSIATPTSTHTLLAPLSPSNSTTLPPPPIEQARPVTPSPSTLNMDKSAILMAPINNHTPSILHPTSADSLLPLPSPVLTPHAPISSPIIGATPVSMMTSPSSSIPSVPSPTADIPILSIVPPLAGVNTDQLTSQELRDMRKKLELEIRVLKADRRKHEQTDNNRKRTHSSRSRSPSPVSPVRSYHHPQKRHRDGESAERRRTSRDDERKERERREREREKDREREMDRERGRERERETVEDRRREQEREERQRLREAARSRPTLKRQELPSPPPLPRRKRARSLTPPTTLPPRPVYNPGTGKYLTRHSPPPPEDDIPILGATPKSAHTNGDSSSTRHPALPPRKFKVTRHPQSTQQQQQQQQAPPSRRNNKHEAGVASTAPKTIQEKIEEQRKRNEEANERLRGYTKEEEKIALQALLDESELTETERVVRIQVSETPDADLLREKVNTMFEQFTDLPDFGSGFAYVKVDEASFNAAFSKKVISKTVQLYGNPVLFQGYKEDRTLFGVACK